jgi:TATA-binding protein-associated factor Taf7
VSELEHKVYESDQEKRVLLDQIKLLENEIMNLRRDNEELSNPVTLRRTLNNHNSM